MLLSSSSSCSFLLAAELPAELALLPVAMLL
jgi:hypothetical protein